MEEQIGLCSEIINKAVRLQDAKLRNQLLKLVGDHRQSLRATADAQSAIDPYEIA